MITVGHFYTLPVTHIVDQGYWLDAKELGSVLLPAKDAPKNLQAGDSVEVFLYLDTEDSPIATTKKPKASVGEFAYLKVVASTDVGAFLDWGLEKDVLVPFAEQHRPMKEGHSYLVYLYLDKIDGRITATSKIDKVLDDHKTHSYKNGQPVDLIIANSTDLGYKAIINHEHWGVLYTNDVFQRLSFGQAIQGFIKHVRPDGKIDLTLQAGQQSRDKNADIILNYLTVMNGFATLNDKSDPQTIVRLLGMSKGAFKKAIGNLYKQRVINIEENGIRLIETTTSDLKGADIETPVINPGANIEDHQQQRIVKLISEPVELFKILKFEGLAGSGGDAKNIIADGKVVLNGEVEKQKRKKIVSGDVIEIGDVKLCMTLGKTDDK